MAPEAAAADAVRALHPDTRAVRGFRAARKRFYRQMLCAHAARQAAGDVDRAERPAVGGAEGDRRAALEVEDDPGPGAVGEDSGGEATVMACPMCCLRLLVRDLRASRLMPLVYRSYLRIT